MSVRTRRALSTTLRTLYVSFPPEFKSFPISDIREENTRLGFTREGGHRGRRKARGRVSISLRSPRVAAQTSTRSGTDVDAVTNEAKLGPIIHPRARHLTRRNLKSLVSRNSARGEILLTSRIGQLPLPLVWFQLPLSRDQVDKRPGNDTGNGGFHLFRTSNLKRCASSDNACRFPTTGIYGGRGRWLPDLGCFLRLSTRYSGKTSLCVSACPSEPASI